MKIGFTFVRKLWAKSRWRALETLYLQHTYKDGVCCYFLFVTAYFTCCIRDGLKGSLYCILCRVLLSGALKDWSKRLVHFLLHFLDSNFSNNIYFSCGSAAKGIGEGTRSRTEGNQVVKLYLCNDGAPFCFGRFPLCMKDRISPIHLWSWKKIACAKFRYVLCELKIDRSTSLQGKLLQHKLNPKVVRALKGLRNKLEEQERGKK